jgi:transcription termination factor Rho
MPDENLSADEAAEVKPKRKPAAKKAAAKKVATKKPAAKKTAAKKAATPRKKKVTAQEEAPQLTPTAEAPAPASAPESAPAAAVEPVASVEIIQATPVLPEPAAPTVIEATQNDPTSQRPLSSQEKRRSKFERWKEKQRQRALERRMAHNGGAPLNGSNGSQPSANGENSAEAPREAPLGPPEPADGILELSPKGFGSLRQRDRSFAQHPQDCWVSHEMIRQLGLREGMHIRGVQRKGHRGPQLTEITEVNNRAPEAMRDLPLFEELKAVNPGKRIQLETNKDRLTTRVIDMITPVGRGQRGLIVAPPRSGKTTILQHVAEAVIENHPGMHLMVLLVDERPEEVTEFRRALPQAEVYASSNDQDVKSHTRIAQFAIERAKRLVECGEHVFLLMDSITRMARAFNNTAKSGATMSGGVGVGALEVPRRLFAAARNTRTAGSLTILATALIETGSKADELIFLEFKGTGNMELVLDRKIAEQFYYPAVNIFKSGTRREELLLQGFQLDKIHMLRRGLAGSKPIDAIQRILTLLERYPSNAQMLVDLPSKPN